MHIALLSGRLPLLLAPVRCHRRLKLVEFDHKVLPITVAGNVGYAAVLTVIDVVSRVTMFIPVTDMTAITTARALFTRWYPMFGVPAVFLMDGAPAFSSDVMHAFYSLMGVKHIDVSAPDDPTHHSTVERRNSVMEKMIDVAISKGDLNNADDLHMYCAAATAACNLEYVYNGHTVLEYLTGEVPRTRAALVSPPLIPPLLGDLDAAFLSQLRSLLIEQHGFIQIARDDDARYSMLVRDAQVGSRVTTSFTLKPGDTVSYDGCPYVLLDLVSPTVTQPTKAVIRDASHSGVVTKTVKYVDLRPLATHRPVHMHSVSTSPKSVVVGDFVFFSESYSPLVEAGKVLNVSSDNVVEVHVHRQAPKMKRRFVPLYLNDTTGVVEPKEVPQAYHSPSLSSVPLVRIT